MSMVTVLFCFTLLVFIIASMYIGRQWEELAWCVAVFQLCFACLQAQEEAKRRLQVEEKNRQELVSDLRKKSRIEYLEKRQADKLVALRDDLADEEDLYSDVR